MPRYWIRAVLEMAENGAGCYRLEQYDWLDKQVRRSHDVYSSKESACPRASPSRGRNGSLCRRPNDPRFQSEEKRIEGSMPMPELTPIKLLALLCTALFGGFVIAMIVFDIR
jgi:hypothetical protein